MIRRTLLVTSLLALPLTLAACGSSLPDHTAARVGSLDVPMEEIQRVIDQQRAQAEQSNTNFAAPGSAEELDLKRNLLDQAINQRITSLEAKACGAPCLASNKEITTRLNTIIKENFNGKRSDFTAFMKENGLSEADVRQIIQFEIEEKKRRARVSKGIRYTLAQAVAYCKANPGQFKQPEQRQASHILVRKKALADQIASEVTADNFAALANQYSIDPGSRTKGGDLGVINRGTLVAPFEKEAFRLKSGEISRPIKTQFGWHIIRVTVTPARDVPCAEAAPNVRRQQLLVKRQEAFDKWKAEMKDKYADKITYADDDLKLPAQPATPTLPGATGQSPASPQAPAQP